MAVSVQAESPGPGRSRGEVEGRSQPRHSAFGASIQLAWWEGPNFRSAAGLLKDISRCGAAALMEAGRILATGSVEEVLELYHTSLAA